MQATESSKRHSLWSRNFILHSLGYLSIAVSFYFLVPVLPLYVVEFLGESKDMVGFAVGLYAFSALLIRPFAGYAYDTLGRRPVYLWAVALYVILLAFYPFTSSLLLLLTLRVCHGVSWGILTTGGSAIATDIVPDDRRGEGLGIFGMSITLSMALAPLLALEVLGDNDYDKLFYSAFGLGLMGIVVVLFMRFPPVDKKRKRITLATMYEKKVLPVSLMMFMGAIPYSAILGFITLYSAQVGMENVGVFFLVYAAGVAIFRPTAGKMMDKQGPLWLIICSFILTTAGLITLSQSANSTVMLVAGFIMGLGNGLFIPVLQTMTMNLVTAERRGVASSTFLSAIDLGIGVGAIITGYLAEAYGISTMFLICGLSLTIPLLYFITFAYRHYKNHKIFGQ